MKKTISKRLISLFFIPILLFSCFCFACSGAVATSSQFIPTEGLGISQYIDPTAEVEIQVERQAIAHQMADCARALGYDDDNVVIALAQAEWEASEEKIQQSFAEANYWILKFEEYPYATYIWLFLTRELGYSDIVAAGILGNMMAEVGGGTLHIQYWLYSYNGGYYYGICQWAKDYFPEVRGKDLIDQCEYLAYNIEAQIDMFGYAYSKDYKFEDFLQLKTTDESALMFAKTYERCNSASYGLRQSYARIAYDYFTGLN